MNKFQVDILAIGVHPDDIELGCGGMLIASVKQGKKVAIVDLTRGELGTRGTVETRKEEAESAAKVMGVSFRDNLAMEDGFFEISRENILKIVEQIRKYQPRVVVCNAPHDRHPDHGRASELTVRACFLAGLRRIETILDGQPQEAWRPSNVYHYIQDSYLEPDFLFDISNVIEDKMVAVSAYKTQFNSPDNSEPQTYISTPDFFERIKARALSFGKVIGVQYAEGFLSEKRIGIADIDALIHQTT
ncbi:MAG: bacillithiol biosynthesis deacetylase BshB1 [Pseudopedobacter saltans]|uniref:Bacillithiol biosynthesis deacetylase BshB1 n=1 Tax=Pseudopedobacter saltans TaxID=151895 RepID=A0A2W5H8A0_9SPHI|nr:MAG: bacillithiol biosynthesis deacetylase BshB1 [Pseudopedobacter saltans]